MQKILIIDDDETILQVAGKFLRKQGFEVFTASNGEAGITLAAQQMPDLVVCDLTMSGMDGYDVLAALRRAEKTMGIPVIYLTGLAEPHQVRHGMNLGVDDYLTKPIVAKDLLAAINARLSRQQSEKQRQEQQIERAMQLFAGIVHDLRDPLFVVFGYTDLLKNAKPGNEGQSDGKQVLDRMQAAIARMQAIVAETMFLAKSRMQRLPFDPGSFDLRNFCAQLLADHDEARRFQFVCKEGACPVLADPLRLRQAMENLLSNALKYSDGTVVVTLSSLNRRYRLEIKDEGIGIPKSEQSSLFEPFFRASNATSRPGNGLGLCIVRSCIEQHGGTIKVVSEPEKGTVFSIDLPATPPTMPTAGAKVEQPGSSGTGAKTAQPVPTAPRSGTQITASLTSAGPGATISSRGNSITPNQARAIIVDDDPLVRDLLRDLAGGFEGVEIVGEAGSVGEARQLVRQRDPNVVLLDVNLPDGSGFDLLPDLKPTTAVVFVTSAEEYAVHAFDCEATDFLLKPVARERLDTALKRVRQRLATPVAAGVSTTVRLSDSFLVKTLTEKKLVKIGEIKSIIAYGEYCWVYWNTNKGALLRKSLKKWLSELPEKQFVRVHRHAIINLAYLDHVEKTSTGQLQVHLRATEKPIEVSLRLAPTLNRRLKAFRS